MLPLYHPAKEEFRLPVILFALSDPHRLHIVRTLASEGELTCTAVRMPLCKSACSRHYKVLREAGLIQMRRSGTAFLNSVRRRELDERFPGLLAAVLRPARAAGDEPAAPTPGAPAKTRPPRCGPTGRAPRRP